MAYLEPTTCRSRGLSDEAQGIARPPGHLRAREAGRRDGPRPEPRGPHARPRGSGQPPARLLRSLLPGRDERHRDEQGSPPANPRDEPGTVPPLRVLRPPARIPPLRRVRRRARVPQPGPPDRTDPLRPGAPRDAGLGGLHAVLPEPRVPRGRVAASGAEPRVRAGIRPRLRVVFRMTRAFARSAEND